MNEDRVQPRLAELREAMGKMEAPDSVEQAALAGFRAEVMRKRRVSNNAVWRWAAAACVLVAALLMGRQWLRPPRTDVALELPKPPVPAAMSVAAKQPPVAVPPAPSAPVKRPRRPSAAALPEQEPPEEDETAAGFVALPWAPPLAPAEDQHLVRVRLPRGAMRQFGMFVREDRVREPVQADFLLGQDGVARAVRLVNSTR